MKYNVLVVESSMCYSIDSLNNKYDFFFMIIHILFFLPQATILNNWSVIINTSWLSRFFSSKRLHNVLATAGS